MFIGLKKISINAVSSIRVNAQRSQCRTTLKRKDC